VPSQPHDPGRSHAFLSRLLSAGQIQWSWPCFCHSPAGYDWKCLKKSPGGSVQTMVYTTNSKYGYLKGKNHDQPFSFGGFPQNVQTDLAESGQFSQIAIDKHLHP